MKKVSFKLLLAAALIFSLNACEKTEEPQKDTEKETGGEGEGEGEVTLTEFPVTNRLLLEDFTGNWCGYCPKAADDLANAKEKNSRIMPVGVHVGDDLAFKLNEEKATALGIEGYPTILINRSEKWNRSLKFLDTYPETNTEIAIAIASSINNDKAEVKATVTFGDKGTSGYYLGYMLLEDGIISSQSNYYDDGRGNPIKDFENNDVLRYTDSNWGVEIKTEDVKSNGTCEKDLSITINPDWDKKECHVVVYVAKKDKKIVNSNWVKLGESVSNE